MTRAFPENHDSILDSIREPLIVLDQGLRVVSANKAFFHEGLADKVCETLTGSRKKTITRQLEVPMRPSDKIQEYAIFRLPLLLQKFPRDVRLPFIFNPEVIPPKGHRKMATYDLFQYFLAKKHH